MVTKFYFARGGVIILVVTRVVVLHHGVHQMIQYRLYQGLLYFQKIIQFQGTHINVIPFMLVTKVVSLHDSFPQNSRHCEPGIVQSCSNSLQAEWSVRGRYFSKPIQTSPGGPPGLHLVSRSKKE